MGSSKSFVLARVTQNRWTILGVQIWIIFAKWALIQVYLPLFIHWHHCFLKIRCVLFKVEELLQYVKSSCGKDGHGSLPSLATCTPVSCTTCALLPIPEVPCLALLFPFSVVRLVFHCTTWITYLLHLLCIVPLLEWKCHADRVLCLLYWEVSPASRIVFDV